MPLGRVDHAGMLEVVRLAERGAPGADLTSDEGLEDEDDTEEEQSEDHRNDDEVHGRHLSLRAPHQRAQTLHGSHEFYIGARSVGSSSGALDAPRVCPR